VDYALRANPTLQASPPLIPNRSNRTNRGILEHHHLACHAIIIDAMLAPLA
jgi:hypothetical protein